MYHLHKWGIKDNPNCTLCNVNETISHAIWECPAAATSLTNLKLILLENGSEIGEINKEQMIFGKARNHDLNTILTLIKQRLILQRENKLALSYDQIKTLIINEITIEKYIIIKNKGSLDKLKKRWKNFKNMI